MGNNMLIYAIGLILLIILAVMIASTLVKSILKLLLAVALVLFLYSVFWGEDSTCISLVGRFFPEDIQEDIMQGYDYYKQQELILPSWKWVEGT